MSLLNQLSLTRSEYVIVSLLEQNETFVVSYETITQALYIKGREPRSNVLPVVIGRIRKKLREAMDEGVIDYAEIETIYSRGIRLLRTPPSVSIHKARA